MKTKIFFTTVLLCFGITVFSQVPDIEWGNTLGGSTSDLVNDLKSTTDGDYIMAGVTDSNNGDIPSNNGVIDGLVAKINPIGEVVWVNTFGGSAFDLFYGIDTTLDGGFVLVGETMSNDGDVSGNNGFLDGWLVKLNENGEMEWQKCVGTDGFDYFRDVIKTTDGGYLAVGHSMEAAWLVKLNIDGIIEWEVYFGGSGTDHIESVIETSDNSFVASGTIDNDGFIVKVDANGETLWEHSYGNQFVNLFNNVKQTSDEGYVVVGRFLVAADNQEAWIVKLDANGEMEWEGTYGGSASDLFLSVIQDVNGSYIATGQAMSMDGDVSNNNAMGGAWVVKLDETGSIVWEKAFGGKAADVFSALVQSNDMGLVLSGNTNSADGDITTGNQGGADAWILKLEAESMSTTAFNASKIIPHPNPTSGILHLQTEERITQAAVYTINGNKFPVQLSETENTIDMSDLLAGVYFVRITVNNHSQTYKIIKE